MNLSQAYSLFKEGKLSVAKSIIESMLEEGLLEGLEYVSARLLEGRILLKQGNYEEAIAKLESLEHKGRGRKDYLNQAERLILIAEALWRLKKYELSLNSLAQAKGILESLDLDYDVKLLIGRTKFREATVKYSLNQLDSSLQGLLECKSIFESVHDLVGLAGVLNNIALIYERKGELSLAKSHYEQSLRIKEQLGDKEDIARTLHNLGRVETSLGNLAKALSLLERSAMLKEEIENKRSLALTLGEIGVVYLMRGELDSAEASFQRVQTIRQEFNDSYGLISSTLNLGLVAHSKNLFDQAREYYLEALKLARKANDTERISRIYHNLVVLETERGNTVLAKRYLEEFEDLTRKSTSSELYYDYLLSKAIVLKSSSRVIDKGEAQRILLNIVNEEVANIAQTITAIIHLCELLFSDYHAFGDESVLVELRNWINRLRDYALRQESADLKAKILIIEGKLALTEGNPQGALSLLSQAQALADDKGLLYLSVQSSLVYDEAIALLSGVRSKRKILPDSSMYNLLRTVANPRQIPFENIVDEIPIAFMIVSIEGDVLFSKQLSEGFAIDRNLVMSFLTLMKRFSDSMSYGQNIGRFSLGISTLLAKRASNVFFFSVIKGSSFSAMQKLEALVQAIIARPRLWDCIRKNTLEREANLLQELNNLLMESYNASIEIPDKGKTKTEISDTEPLEFEFPTELLKHKRLLHPVKLAILNLLAKHYRLATSDVRKLLGIPWDNLETHLNSLRSAGLIEQKVEFVGDRARQILYLTHNGTENYSAVTSALQKIILES